MKIFEALAKTLLLFLIAATTLCLLQANASAQICAGSSLRYVVRDGQGKVIDPTGLYESKARVGTDELKEAQKVIKGITVASIKVLRASGMCNFREPVRVALKLKGKEMNLVFLMPRFGEYESRSFLVDSLPFRPGTFEIDLSGAGETNPAGDWLGSFFPAKRWKKVEASNHTNPT
jgi:hypothetical protein